MGRLSPGRGSYFCPLIQPTPTLTSEFQGCGDGKKKQTIIQWILVPSLQILIPGSIFENQHISFINGNSHKLLPMTFRSTGIYCWLEIAVTTCYDSNINLVNIVNSCYHSKTNYIWLGWKGCLFGMPATPGKFWQKNVWETAWSQPGIEGNMCWKTCKGHPFSSLDSQTAQGLWMATCIPITFSPMSYLTGEIKMGSISLSLFL